MNDWAQGKQMTEEVMFEIFQETFNSITGRELTFVSQGESPDFETLIEGVPTGLELTEVRKASDEDDLFATAYAIAAKKDASYRRRNLFTARPIILVCYSYSPAFHDIQHDLSSFLAPEDFDELGFSEVWFMDLNEAYYSPGDPRRRADLFCAKPDPWRGFHRDGDHGRKPFG